MPLHVSVSCRSGVSFTGLPFSRFSRSVGERKKCPSPLPLFLLIVLLPTFTILSLFFCECTRLRGAADALDSWAHNFCEDTRVNVCARRSEPITSALRRSGGDETKREPASVSPFRPKFCVSGQDMGCMGVLRGFVSCRLIHVH